MRLIITTQVFPPETHPTAVMTLQLAEDLAANGAEVTVAAGFPHHPHGRVLGGYRKRLLLNEKVGRVEVRRGWHLTSPNMSFAVRAVVMATQALGTALAALGGKRPDVILNFGPPLAGPLLSAMVAKLRRARSVAVIYDLYPDIAIDAGKLRSPLLVAMARFAERLVYRWSDRVVVLSDGFRRTLEARGVPARKIEVVPVWLDPDEITPRSRENAWRREQGIPADKKVVLYAGTIGLISGAAIVLDAAERLADRADLLFLFVGEGRVKDQLEQDAKRRGLANVRFLPFQPRERLPEVQATADLAIVTLLPGRGRTSVPSKVVGYMAAGRPVVASVDEDSDTAEVIRSGSWGVAVAPGRADLLTDAVRRLVDSRELGGMGAAARQAFEVAYAKQAAIGKLRAILDRLANEGPR